MHTPSTLTPESRAPATEPAPDAAGIPGAALTRLWNRIEAIGVVAFLSWVAVLLVVRSGVSWSDVSELSGFALELPHPGSSFRSNAVLGPLLAGLTGMGAPGRYVVLHGILTAGWFVAAAWLLRRRLGSAGPWRAGLVWLSFTTLPTSLLRQIGSYDVYLCWGALLVALGGSPAIAAVGGALMGATNIEQGLLVLVCGAMLHWATSDERDGAGFARTLRTFGPAVGALLASRAVVLVWFHRVDASVQTRSDAFWELLADSLTNALHLGGAGLYSWLAAGWVLVLVLLWQLRDRPARWIAAATGSVLIPAAATVTTLDGSRVFSSVSAVAVLVLVVHLAQQSELPTGRWMRSGAAALLCAGLLLPALNTTYTGGLRIPWRFALG